MNEIKWFDLNETLSYNAMFNIIIGNRNIGKTYGTNDKLIKDFLKDKWEFIYVRRHDSDLEKVMPTFFDKIKEKFPSTKFKVNSREFKINGEHAGIAIPLSKAQSYKSSSFPKVKYIFLDEFLIDGESGGYLKGEVQLFLSLVGTVFRLDRLMKEPQNCRVIMCANNVSMMNPYFMEWGIEVNNKKRFSKYKDGSILLQVENNEGVGDAMRNTALGKIINGTSYGNYAIDNKSLYDSNTFIATKSPKAEYACTIIYNGFNLGLWWDSIIGNMFISYKVDPCCKMVYAFTTSDHQPNMILVQRMTKSYWLKLMMDCFKVGALFFENQQIKGIVYEILKLRG